MQHHLPLERLLFIPNRILRIEEEILVVAENIRDHQTNERKEEILRAE
jgi:hypothetical protein